MELDRIIITGARQHNLKNVTVEIPKKKLVILTGVSGSGKSSLAFDTLYAEGQRRYIESLNAYARQFLGQMDKPLYDSIRGLAPTISIEQKAASGNPRSTVGTVTEIHDYLRVLWARVGKLTCHNCGRAVSQQSSQQIVHEIQGLKPGVKFLLLAPLVKDRKGEHRDVLDAVRKSGFTRVRVDGIVLSLDDEIRLDKKKKHRIDAVVDRLIAKAGQSQRLHDSVETALRHGQGTVIVAPEGETEQTLSEHRACHHCGISFPEPSPQLFSFNSPQGMCPECSGLGTRMEMDPELVVPNPELSVNEGAVKPLGAVGEGTSWGTDIVRAVARERAIDLNKPWKLLPPPHRKVLLYGTGDERVKIQMRGSWGTGAFKMKYEGAINSMMRRMRETHSEEMRTYYQKFLSNRPCSGCAGRRIRPEALGVKLGGKNIAEVTALSVAQAFTFFDTLDLKGSDAKIATELLKEIRSRLRFLLDVGLNYLTLDRPAPTLSGGESQRIRLASQIGSELTGVVYVLDEPSIGLHQRDNRKLLAALKHLRDIGNSVVVVEHDREAMEESDWLIDFGPGAGRHGGADRGRGHAGRGHGHEGEPHRPVPPRRPPHRAARRAPPGRRTQDHGGGRGREQPEARDGRRPPGRLRLRHRGVGRGQEHAHQPDPLPGGGARPARQRRCRWAPTAGSTAWPRSTRSSTSTRARSAAHPAATPPPTPSSSTSSATSSRSCRRRGCTATPLAASPST